ncbi:MAG TPA: hypothetical protein VFI23_08515 [Rhizomicrobium sp.]|nr:hypothetical protein [Rhizomicrobium sp.]
MRGLKKGLLGLFLLCAAPAVADTVSDDTIGAFVDNHSAVSRLNKIARWEDPVCPVVTGLPPNFIKFIAKRVRDVAAQAGAPVNADENCKANIDIVFTSKPQAFLDVVRVKQPVLLGYYDNTSQADHLAMVTRAIQAWHTTQTVDLRGHPIIDSRDNVAGGRGLTSNVQNSSGTRLGDGLHSSFYHAFVVADPGKLGDYEIGTLADHIAMLALAPPAPGDACADLPSILDITNPNCRKDAQAKTLTVADTGYLRGLYQADSGAFLRTQKDGIAFHIKSALAAKP